MYEMQCFGPGKEGRVRALLEFPSGIEVPDYNTGALRDGEVG